MQKLPADNRLKGEKADILIDSMYEARQAAYAEMGPAANISSTSDLT